MAAKRPTGRTARCAFCEETFTVQPGPGPEPIYCSQAHRQRSYELRRRTGRSEIEKEMAEELQALRARVGVLQVENKQLRQALNESTDEVTRLQNELDPPAEAVLRLAGAPLATMGPLVPNEPAAPQPRRWWTRADT